MGPEQHPPVGLSAVTAHQDPRHRRPQVVIADGTAADWHLRFLVHPQPDMYVTVLGVMQCARAKISLLTAFAEIAESLGAPRSSIAADL